MFLIPLFPLSLIGFFCGLFDFSGDDHLHPRLQMQHALENPSVEFVLNPCSSSYQFSHFLFELYRPFCDPYGEIIGNEPEPAKVPCAGPTKTTSAV